MAEQGIEAVSMEAVAKAACVGTGTLYRRFGDRAGLAFALLDEQTRDFQNALISGPPPLGPGAPACERLRAFGHGYLDLLERHATLMVAAAPGGKEADGPWSLYTTHLAILLREAAPLLDPQFTAEALLAMLAPAHHLRMRGLLGWPLRADARRAGTRWSRRSAAGLPVAHDDPGLTGHRAQRVVVAGGHDRLAARAEQVLLAVEAQLGDAVDHAQQRVLVGTQAQGHISGQGLEDQLGAVGGGGGGGDQGSHC